MTNTSTVANEPIEQLKKNEQSIQYLNEQIKEARFRRNHLKRRYERNDKDILNVTIGQPISKRGRKPN